MSTNQPKVGDIVFLPCRVVGVSMLAGRWGAGEPVVDLRPIESTSGEPFGEHIIKPFTVYARDVQVPTWSIDHSEVQG